MLELKNIMKNYITGDTTVTALNGISVEFRKSEFVSILGPSGCGKTTLLNIIGGLDRYSDGDLIIKSKSTKQYRDRDWDAYRNHSIGFVFQSYNLIPHQTVLQNVELALTISGVSSKKRKQMAKDALAKVGLADQLNKKPNQMSGGQMQRVAIARALVNNPEIVLADEPTGALDSETSVQIMELLKEIANDRLVIMVTHNPELAEKYSTRIIKLFDGKIISDSNEYKNTEAQVVDDKKKTKGTSMSFGTALSLSLKNLFTKKARTILTSFAGSIGIIGIALILSLSSGVDAYIDQVEEDTLSSYPITIEDKNMDFSQTLATFMGDKKSKTTKEDNTIYSNDIIAKMMTGALNGLKSNDLKTFKKHIEANKDELKEYTSDIKYTYKTQLNIYTEDGYQVNPSTIFSKMFPNSQQNQMSNSFSNTDVWNELIDNEELLKKQYDVYGKMPSAYNEVVLIVDKNNEISDYTLYSLGIKDPDELSELAKEARSGKKLEDPKQTKYSYNEFLNKKFKLLINSDLYQINDKGIYEDHSEDKLYIVEKLKNAVEIKIVGILKPSENNKSSNNSGFIGYTPKLMTTLINEINESEVVKYQKENSSIDIFTGRPFKPVSDYTMDDIYAYIATLDAEKQSQTMGYISQMKAQGIPDAEIIKSLSSNIKVTSLEDNLFKLGVSDLDNPSGINIYPKDFESKDKINEFIKNYNKNKDKDNQIEFTDYVGLLMSSVTTIINAITYILIAFVSISLIVSSIMIGIITYISVLERTKEIGILRAMGASKRDVSNVFNAETFIIGLTSGLIGIGVTSLLLIPINIIIKAITDISGLAVLPPIGAIVLIVISMVLTLVAGLIPSRLAAKKDPVISLRSE